MDQLQLQAHFEPFFAQLAAAPQRTLLLDYDSILAPLVARPSQAAPYSGVREVLTEICNAGCTRVVIISGRSVADLERLIGLDPLPELWGGHGWERRLPDGTYQPPVLSEQARAGLEEAHALLEARGLRHTLELKPGSLALHWRGLDDKAVAMLRETVGHLWTPLVLRSRLRVHSFEDGLELRVPGQDKGAAVRAVLSELEPNAALAYLGDELTNDGAFQALNRRGLRVLVRQEHRLSATDFWLRPPGELLSFLHAWLCVDTAQRPAAARETVPYERSDRS